ncbi:MAG: ornithine aminomutase subunit alpha [Candidatus Izemoplasmataceae bacterium]|jgi:D-ornithine 4,5-aminomutase subunit alpha
MKERNDDYLTRRKHLEGMTDSELKKYFYELSDKLVDPLLELSYTHTTKSIERSILLRMGFSSIEANEIANKLNEYNLLRKGAGHCVYKIATEKNMSIREAGISIIEEDTIDFLQEVFNNG